MLEDRAAVVDQGREEADRIIEAAKAERARMIARTEVVREATREADSLLTAARTDAERMRVEIDDYVDGKLANFEIVLNRTLHAVEHGRNKINGRHELEALQEVDEDEEVEPLPG